MAANRLPPVFPPALGGFDDEPTPVTSVPPPLPPIAMSPVQRTATFGRFEWVSSPIEGNPERILMKGDWFRNNVISVEVPQLQKLGVSHVLFHYLGKKQLLGFFADVEAAGLLPLVKTWNGSFASRMKRGKANGGIGDISNHAWATAFDINAQWNRLGQIPALAGRPGSVRELVPLMHKHGFFWGGDFRTRPDGMHVELSRVIA
jgi:D-alanyl-D-alanine carboxypeptidase